MKKLIAPVILVGLAWWFFDYSHRMTETKIRAAYEADLDAMRRFDNLALCDRLASDFSGVEITRQGAQSVERHYDRQALCKRLCQSLSTMRRLHEAGASTGLQIELEVKSIELSPNRKHATVETVSTVRLGDMTLARDRTIEHLISRGGHILSAQAESRVWAYAPE